ncbi:DUF4062 domain-containing protein [Reinekea marina]|uniref:DUF4062 domain-containing protein n=1 Tax=Reinekea marina TaxID=1310421 RepID=A0ABV7WUL7_9GAMM|nr:DUF4062 domain-containing protein [Reinekea marina]MDN3649276.1 DUF4062 domain-containing protein [Reinekea marina]
MQTNRVMVMVASFERHLEAERKVIYEAIVGQRGLPVGLSFPSMPANYLLKLNAQCLADADYLFLLLGKEYGPVTEKGTSHLHQIYAAAQAARKPIISFVYQGEHIMGVDPFDQKRREGFIASLQKGDVFYWSNNDELRDAIERGLELVQENHPSPGWSKAAEVAQTEPNRKVDQDIIGKLKAQIDHLKHKIEKATSPFQHKALDFDVDRTPWLAEYSCNAFREGRLKQFNGTLRYDITEVFDWLSAALLSPISEVRVQALLARNIHSDVLNEAKSTWRGCHAVSDVKVDQVCVDKLKKRLRLMGIVVFDDNGRWRLTQAAETYALMQSESR